MLFKLLMIDWYPTGYGDWIVTIRGSAFAKRQPTTALLSRIAVEFEQNSIVKSKRNKFAGERPDRSTDSTTIHWLTAVRTFRLNSLHFHQQEIRTHHGRIP